MLTLYDNIMKVNNPSWESTTHISVFYLHGYSRCVSKISNLSRFPTSNANIKQVVFDVMNYCWFSFNNLWQNFFFQNILDAQVPGWKIITTSNQNHPTKPEFWEKLSTPTKPTPFWGFPGFRWLLAPGVVTFLFLWHGTQHGSKKCGGSRLGRGKQRVKTWKAALGTSGVV